MLFQPDSTEQDIAAAYERHFATLTKVAEQFDVPAPEADSLIQDVLLSALIDRRAGAEVNTWLRAALISAIENLRAQS
jgi:hypothetical protein